MEKHRNIPLFLLLIWVVGMVYLVSCDTGKNDQSRTNDVNTKVNDSGNQVVDTDGDDDDDSGVKKADTKEDPYTLLSKILGCPDAEECFMLYVALYVTDDPRAQKVPVPPGRPIVSGK